MPNDVVISCWALKSLPDSASLLEHEPALFEWSPGTGTWGKAADAIRAPPWRKGRLLPALFKRYERFLGFDLDGASRIAVFGFSAGSNSGVRELLRNPEDRARIDFVAAVDGLHPNIKPDRLGTPLNLATPRDYFADWNAELEPFAAMAERAARHETMMIATASQVVPLGKYNAKTELALDALVADVSSRVAFVDPYIVPGFPTDRAEIRAGERHPVPVRGDGLGNFVCFWYSGSDKRAHVLQAQAVVPDIFRDYLVPSWTSGGFLPVGIRLPSPTGTPGAGGVSSDFALGAGLALAAGIAIAVL